MTTGTERRETPARRYNHPMSRLLRLWRDPYGAVMQLVGDHTVGGRSVPTTWRHGYIGPSGSPSDTSRISLMVENDAFGLSIRRQWPDGDGWTDSDLYGVNRREARLIAWWIVRWFAADWFGLRRRIYYAALTRHLNVVSRRVLA